MLDPIILVPYDPEWPALFQATAQPIRAAIGEIALRIDHIGSTAIPGIAAKPIIDILISVEAFEPFEAIRGPLERLGYVWRDDNPDQTKRFFREPPGTRRTHIHVHKIGSFQQQMTLLLRDYLREHPDARRRYEAVKQELAIQFKQDRGNYVEGKSPIVWEIMAAALKWLQATDWEPGPSDA